MAPMRVHSLEVETLQKAKAGRDIALAMSPPAQQRGGTVVPLNAARHNAQQVPRVPEKLRAWQSASHIERAPQREKHPSVTIVSSPASAPKDKAA